MACGRTSDPVHAGTWELDANAIREVLEAGSAATEDPLERQGLELGLAMLETGMLDVLHMDLVLHPDGTASSTTRMMGESETVRGSWYSRGDRLTIEMVQNGHSEPISARVTGEILELIPPPGEEMPFPILLRRRGP